MCSMTDKVIQLTESAFKFGPFLFAILFTLVYANLAHRYYKKASPEDKATYRYHFGAITIFGWSLVIISLVWWFYDRPQVYVFKGVIENLREYEKLVSGKVYLRPQSKPKLIDTSPEEFRDVFFIAVRESPFEQGQTFEFSYGKDRTGEMLEIEYAPSGHSERRYKVEYDKEKERNVLREKGLGANKTSSVGNVAFAYEPVQYFGEQATKSRVLGQLTRTDKTSSSGDDRISAIERSQSKVSEKIAGLDELLRLSNRDLQRYFETPSPESRVITLLDLTRHTDDELASKAQKVVARYPLHEHVANQFLDEDPLVRQMAEETLFRIEPYRADAILRIVESKRNKNVIPHEKLQELRRKVGTGESARLIVPTGTSYGDLYYLKAEWTGRETPICAAKILYGAVSHGSGANSLAEYEAEVAGSSAYYVYAKDKFQTLNLARSIEKCGAKVSLVGYNPQ